MAELATVLVTMCIMLAVMLVFVYSYFERKIDNLEHAHETLDEQNLRLNMIVAALTKHQGLSYPPKEKVTPAVPEKRVYIFEKLKK